MEKEQKGLFDRLLDFWKENFEVGVSGEIGFWNDAGAIEKPLAEMGAVASLVQEETKKMFRDGGTEDFVTDREKSIFIPEYEAKEQENRMLFEEEPKWKGLETTFALQRELPEKAMKHTFLMEMPEKVMKHAFLMEMPEKEKRRNVMPVADEKEKKPVVLEEEANESERKSSGKEESLPETVVDVEKLMRDMTKKLWEERESCGRRLR